MGEAEGDLVDAVLGKGLVAGPFQPVHSRTDGGARDVEIDGEIGDAAPPIVAQQRNELFVECVHVEIQYASFAYHIAQSR